MCIVRISAWPQTKVIVMFGDRRDEARVILQACVVSGKSSSQLVLWPVSLAQG